ncbi:strawberry notch family protein [Skeletonema marinoi]|uniref:Strawberry notch family protein n=1 Tax=Skeletonema marinoi TaxID=267567 RepID=A0AAD8YCV5_9STRA|nr:strawberry notch family protein [Skeletonema marinoi]
MQMFPLPPKPAGVIAPEFLNHLKKDDIVGDDGTVDTDTASVSDNSLDLSLDSSRPSRRARKAVSYDERNVSSEGVILNLGKKGGAGKKAGKKRNSSSADSGDESDFTVDISGDELSDSDSDDDDDAFDLKKKTPSQSIAWNEIPLEYDETNMSIADRVDHKRKANYRRAAEKVKGWLDTVDSLSLPANPLDRLLNELGGPDQVAELTGRKSRQIKQYNAMTDKHEVIYQKRKGENCPMDQINIEEKNNFQNGTKLVAILSEAASTGISLQADKRVKNQRRRVHITIELPWSADKAIQQLGRTHRSNQTTGPLYKFLISDVGGEKRFASAVAKRLALLGALTQGDRRATGSANSLGLSAFDMDNQYGSRALQTMLREIWNCASESPLDGEVDDGLYVEALKMIDGHLKEALDGEERGEGTLEENLVPFDDDTEGEKTFRSMMYHLLTGPCQKLAASRVTAIREGRGLGIYFESLADGSEDKESVKAKIDAEFKSALDAGLNFNVSVS